MGQLINASQEAYGARYQRRVSDGHNPFGPSDHYISIYRGWIVIPQPGSFKFCTASNEASFSFLDGQPLVHWPGRHTSERGLHGEKNATVELEAGAHYLEYYHEEVMLKQVAFLGWSPPGTTEGHFSAIPESSYPEPYVATVVSYEKPDGSLVWFEPEILDSIWPTDRHEGQYTRVEFRVGDPGAFPADTTYQWRFGDGQTAAGPRVEHVYLHLGRYGVTLTADTPSGASITGTWPLQVYEMQHVTGDIQQGRPRDYSKIAATYDPQRLDAANLQELVHLLAESDLPENAQQVGQTFIERFAETHREDAGRVRRRMALCALAIGDEGIDQAIANFQASVIETMPAAEKIDSLAQLIVLLGIERGQPDRTGEFLEQVEQAARQSHVDDVVKAAYRRAINAAGDVALWNGGRSEARGYYRRVEALCGHYIPEQVRAARVGAYPKAIRDFLNQQNYGAALDIVDQWEDKFATEKVKGHTFFGAERSWPNADSFLEPPATWRAVSALPPVHFLKAKPGGSWPFHSTNWEKPRSRRSSWRS